MQKATFAGGCFWCLVPPFEDIEGVVKIEAGYCGKDEGKPKYHEVASGKTGYREAVQITYDERKVSYRDLADIFWRQIDPIDSGGQFADRGESYRTAIYFHNLEQKKIAEETKKDIQGLFSEPIATEIARFEKFYLAEEEHQDYHKKNPIRYNMYKAISGRLNYLERTGKRYKEIK